MRGSQVVRRPKADRDRRVRARRASGISTRRLAREFRISQVRIRQILADTGGDPLAPELEVLAAMTDAELEREAANLEDLIRARRRRLRMVHDEQEARRTDRILGLTG